MEFGYVLACWNVSLTRFSFLADEIKFLSNVSQYIALCKIHFMTCNDPILFAEKQTHPIGMLPPLYFSVGMVSIGK